MLRHGVGVDLPVSLDARQERDLLPKQDLHGVKRQVPGVQYGELGVDLHGLELGDGGEQRRHVDDVAWHVAHVDWHSRSALHHVYEPDLPADVAVVVAHGSDRQPHVVGQARAVDEDGALAGVGWLVLEPGDVGGEEPAAAVLPADGGEHVAQPLGLHVRAGEQDPSVAPLVPVQRMGVAPALEDVVEQQRLERVGAAVAGRLDHGPQSVPADVLVDEVRVAEVDYELLARVGPRRGRGEIRRRRGEDSGLGQVLEDAALAALEHQSRPVEHPA